MKHKVFMLCDSNMEHRKINKNSKYLFFKKYKKFLHHNRDMKALISMIGKESKKGTKSGRPKNSKNKI